MSRSVAAASVLVCLLAAGLRSDGNAATLAAAVIVFESTRTGDSDIWSMTEDGRRQTNLTKNPAALESTPALSPDGKRIAFVRSSGDRYQLWLMNADGTGQRRLGAGRGTDVGPVWSPSGDRIAFATLIGKNWDIWVTTLDGKRTQLTGDPGAEVDVSWDPEGETLVFDRILKGGSDLWTVSADGGTPRPLTRTPGVAELNPAWSPKGDEIAYDATIRGVYDLYVLDVASGKVRRLTRDAADDGDPAWSPDASTIVYRRSSGSADYEIALVASSGAGKPRNVSRDPAGIDIAPSISVAASTAIFRTVAGPARPLAINWVFACDQAWPGTTAPDDYTGNSLVNRMCGDGATDVIRGGAGGDWISGGSGASDRAYGNTESDKLKMRDSTKDYAYGGTGIDYALLDSGDVTDVENVEYPSY